MSSQRAHWGFQRTLDFSSKHPQRFLISCLILPASDRIIIRKWKSHTNYTRWEGILQLFFFLFFLSCFFLFESHLSSSIPYSCYNKWKWIKKKSFICFHYHSQFDFERILFLLVFCRKSDERNPINLWNFTFLFSPACWHHTHTQVSTKKPFVTLDSIVADIITE